MSLSNLSRCPAPAGRARTCAPLVHRGAALLLLFLLSGCGDSTGPGGGGGGGASLSGTVRVVGAATVLPDAVVSLGTRTATTDVNGQFELTNLPVGAGTVLVTRPGYEDAEVPLTIASGANSHDFALTVKEVYVAGSIAALVPAGSGPIRATIIMLGGPDASGFVTGERIVPPDRPPELEATMQALGAGLRALSRELDVALLGSGVLGMASNSANDAQLFQSLATVAASSDHPEITAGPVLMLGISGGSREAAGLVARNPDRSLGLLVRVPAEVTALTAPEALAVPTFVIQGAEDDVVDNPAVQAVFATNRSRHGLWALAVEPGVGHRNPTSEGNTASINWIREAITRRLPAVPGGPLTALDEASGWLGNQATLGIAPWADYTGFREEASWLLSQAAANAWKALGTDAGGGGGGS